MENLMENLMENIIDTFELELRALAEQHRGIAVMLDEQDAEEHYSLAEIYDCVAECAQALVEKHIKR